jgi:hypothetical protein
MAPFTYRWTPAAVRQSYGLAQNMPMAPAASALPGALPAVVSGALVLGLAVAGTLFSYGLASESKSKTTRISGYVLAGASALSGLLFLGGVVTGAMKS